MCDETKKAVNSPDGAGSGEVGARLEALIAHRA